MTERGRDLDTQSLGYSDTYQLVEVAGEGADHFVHLEVEEE